jgi:VanZ family protein
MLQLLRKNYIPFIGCAMLILVLSVMKTNQLPHVPVTDFDKLIHFTMYFGFTLTLLWSLLTKQNLHNKYLMAILTCASYGLLMECVQGLFCTYRFFEWWDAFSNAAGAAGAGGLTYWWMNRNKKTA